MPTRQRTILNLLTVAAVLAALGSDYLAKAGEVVRSESVVTMAERMASRLSGAFVRKAQHPAIRSLEQRQTIASAPILDILRGRTAPPPQIRCELSFLHLPPPLA